MSRRYYLDRPLSHPDGYVGRFCEERGFIYWPKNLLGGVQVDQTLADRDVVNIKRSALRLSSLFVRLRWGNRACM